MIAQLRLELAATFAGSTLSVCIVHLATTLLSNLKLGSVSFLPDNLLTIQLDIQSLG